MAKDFLTLPYNFGIAIVKGSFVNMEILLISIF